MNPGNPPLISGVVLLLALLLFPFLGVEAQGFDNEEKTGGQNKEKKASKTLEELMEMSIEELLEIEIASMSRNGLKSSPIIENLMNLSIEELLDMEIAAASDAAEGNPLHRLLTLPVATKSESDNLPESSFTF